MFSVESNIPCPNLKVSVLEKVKLIGIKKSILFQSAAETK